MSSSENEEFESADEEYEESRRKVSPTAKKDVEPTEAHRQKNDKQLTKNITKADNVENTFISEETSCTVKCADREDKADKPQPVNKVTPTCKNLNKTEKAHISDTDGWELNDWDIDEQDIQEKKVVLGKKTDNAEEGWSDFDDDWDDEPISETNKVQKENISSVFPILNEFSENSDKPSKVSDGPLPNLSKLVIKREVVSNYDAFPVLNNLSSNEKCNSGISNAEVGNIGKCNVGDTKNAQAVSSSWSWKPWGGVVSTIFSTATEGVTSLTSHVSQGLSNVIESGMGVPDPEEMARINKEAKQQLKSTKAVGDKNEDEVKTKSIQEETLLPSFGNIVSGVTQIGNKVITGGLDTLEGIGKKTMTILQENDPLLLNKRKMLGLEIEKPVLSQVLREAKEKSEEVERNLKQMHRNSYKKQLHFETLFDHYYGLVHLEALEMLSKQSSLKLQSLLEPLSGNALSELNETLNEVKELCELGDMDHDENDGIYTANELSEKLNAAVEDLDVETDFKDILRCWEDNIQWLTEKTSSEPQEVYEKGLRCLAETCALAIHRYHKLAEMLLIKDHHSTANEADSLVQLTVALCWHLNGIAARFGGKLNGFVKNEETSSLITSIFVEVYNSNSYVQSAFQLFIPILQIGAA